MGGIAAIVGGLVPAPFGMRLDPTSLKRFVSLVEEGTIARAGEREHLSAEVKAPYRFVNEGRKPCAYCMAIVRKR